MVRGSTDEQYWRGHLKPFIEFDSDYESAGEIYVPREHLNIAFLFEGGFRVAGDRSSLQINFNAPGLLILLFVEDATENIYRIPWSRLVGFQLISKRQYRGGKSGKPNLVLFPGGKHT